MLTEKMAEEMAEEIEREDFDISNFKILYVGYPVLGGVASGSGVAFPLSRTELDALRQRVEKEGRSFSDAIREKLKRRKDS